MAEGGDHDRDGLAAVGFDPSLHSQETRGRFCAQHGADKPTDGAAVPTAEGVLSDGEHAVVSDGVALLIYMPAIDRSLSDCR